MNTEILKRFRQTWLTDELMHSAPSAYLCEINGEPWAQLEHPHGGPLTCVKYRGKETPVGVVKLNGQWHWEIAAREPKP